MSRLEKLKRYFDSKTSQIKQLDDWIEAEAKHGGKDDPVEILVDLERAEHRVSHAENTPGYSDFEFVEKCLLRLRPQVQDDQKNKEKWSNLVARLNKLRYG